MNQRCGRSLQHMLGTAPFCWAFSLAQPRVAELLDPQVPKPPAREARVPLVVQPPDSLPPAIRVPASPPNGFWSPYHIHVPPSILGDSAPHHVRSILVMPNNTGADTDDPQVHDARVRDIIPYYRGVAARLGVVVLMPAFPRPKSQTMTYTHALDRDAMLASDETLRRPDLQTIAMVDDARGRLAALGVRTESRILMHGHSAVGMFVNRFLMLHPGRVKAASIGAPGGWPIVPVGKFAGESLRYPVGVADLPAIGGSPSTAAQWHMSPSSFFSERGTKNDSVPYDDSYDPADRTLIVKLFGNTPVERWQQAEPIYRQVVPTVEWKLYRDVGHEITRAMWSDIWTFLGRHAASRQVGR